MRSGSGFTIAAVLLSLLGAAAAFGQAAPDSAGAARLIIKLRPGAPAAPVDARRQPQRHRDRVRGLAERAALRLLAARELGNGMMGIALQPAWAGGDPDAVLATLRADPEIEFAEIDQRRYARAMPTDTLYPGQWYLQGAEVSAANFEAAWDTTTGAADTVIAVLDTGIRFEHPDLSGRVLPGYDFVSGESSSSFVTANDGDDWDDDASDPGDWVTFAETQSGPLATGECEVSASSWHGTRVAAMIAATTDNAAGVAGGTWAGSVLPVRVLGKCGGYDSDIIAGMRWAAGLDVDDAPENETPARIINLSLGSPGSCTRSYREAFAELADAGVLVVASAGNDSGPVEAPANCAGALAVGGLRQIGTKVGYSSFGSQIAVSAPAGNCPDLLTTGLCSYSLITADNTGTTAPAASSYTDDFNYNIGTSFSAPIVSAIAALMHAVNDQLDAESFAARLRSSARPFPAPDPGIPLCPALDPVTAQCNCTTSTCGAGIADAPGAVAEALRPVARIDSPDGSGAGRNVTLNGSGSTAARGRTLSSYAWTAVSGDPVFVGGTGGASAIVAVPSLGLVKVALTVTDNFGSADTREVELGTTSSGGGGAVHPLLLMLLLLIARLRCHRPPAH